MHHRLYGQSIIWAQDFTPDLLEETFERADRFAENPRNKCLRNKEVGMIFYEESTRTRLSFEKAVHDLGGSVFSTENARLFSSAAKGETLEDSMRVISSYCNAIVLRHFEDNAAVRARDFLQSLGIWRPIINAGCGKGQHPTQSVIDLYTIKKEIGRTDHLKCLIIGDLNQRAPRSMSYLLGKFPGNSIAYVSPVELAMGYDLLAYLRRHNTPYTESTEVGDLIEECDVVYVTRLQKERLQDPADYERLKGSYSITPSLAQRMQPHARILHPLPKVDEIHPQVYRLPQAAYYRQSDNGVPIRKALLEMVLGE